ncbi:RrF2 family transcriptional regulator [Candidatus Uabimicrobium amorphum]|uniref:Transcriptional regulator n=1 Tax=Uabimicrobium amorphum TaxID=2596890 RepID=A0A5S9F243_UABAM|nr:Rrf2 family transcriptional regulator [Candidatus Uabimicrobium amorphum]BBM83072.1 transcriptional regulator [Candidatus Uabimicrobium amorphum]
MLKFNKKTEYAIMALLHMSENNKQVCSVREIAEKFSIPKELLRKVLHALAQKNVIESIQGVRGGFKMTRCLHDISVIEIINATHKPVKIVDCVDSSDCECPQNIECNIKGSMLSLQDELSSFFSSITLQDLQNKNYLRETSEKI